MGHCLLEIKIDVMVKEKKSLEIRETTKRVVFEKSVH